MSKIPKKTEQTSSAEIKNWERMQPNSSFEIVNGKIVERPVPKVATPKKSR